MCLRSDMRSRRMFFVAQLALLCFSLMYVPIRHYPDFHPDLMDAARGMFLGVAIAAMALWARSGRRAA